MRKMRGEVVKKTPKKRWSIPHFYDVKGIKSGTDWASSDLLRIVIDLVKWNKHDIIFVLSWD